jgi:MFS family permease
VATPQARRVWLLGPVLALALLPSNVVATALPLLRTEWSASATEIGAVFAAYQVGYVAAVVLLLPLTDRVPAGWVIVGSSVTTAIAFLLFPLLAHDPLTAGLLRALVPDRPPRAAEAYAEIIVGACERLALWRARNPEITAEEAAGHLMDLTWSGLAALAR